MKIWTKSKKALQAQKSVMEFLLINHPLDCPICDQGGECELQDISMGYGSDVSRFTEKKRVVIDEDLGPLIASDMTRCIQCTRCVRFGTEISGVRELGTIGRGEHLEISTFVEENIDSEVSGNVIELCPVGALTSKPYRFQARGWELTQKASIAAHDCLGSNIHVHTRRGKILRVVPKENEAVNEVWISDRDRFSYEGLSVDRLSSPKIKRNGVFEEVTWTEALEYAAQLLQKTHKTFPEHIGALLSPNSTTEEAYLLQKLIRSLGSSQIDHRLRQVDFRDQQQAPLFPNLGLSFTELENQSLVLLVGSLIRQEQPLLGLKLRQVTVNGGEVMVINPLDTPWNFPIKEKVIVPAGDLLSGLVKVVKALTTELSQAVASVQSSQTMHISYSIPENLKSWFAKFPEPSSTDIHMAQALMRSEKTTLLLGALALHHPESSRLQMLANWIGEWTGAKIGFLTEGANAAGAWLAGAVPHRLPGGQTSVVKNDTQSFFEKKLKTYVLFGIEPDLDVAQTQQAKAALKQAESVIVITPFENEYLTSIADVLLPSCPFTENAGTFMNASGQWQAFQAATLPYANSKPGWRILRVLGNLLDLPGFDYESTEAVFSDLKQQLPQKLPLNSGEPYVPEQLASPQNITIESLVRIAPVALYDGDNIVRRAKSLQKTEAAGPCIVRLNSKMAEKFHLQDAEQVEVSSAQNAQGPKTLLPLMIDEQVPDHAVFIAAAKPESGRLPPGYAMLSLHAVNQDESV